MDTDDQPTNKPTEKRWSAATARKILDELAASGLSRAAFARARGLKAHRLKRWQARLGDDRPTTKVAFIPAEISSTACVVVRLPTGIAIEAPSVMALPPAWVSELARTLAVKR